MSNNIMRLEGNDYEVLEFCSPGGGYDWQECGLFRRVRDGALFVGEDGGCSCTGFGDNIDWTPVWSMREGLRVFREASKHCY